MMDLIKQEDTEMVLAICESVTKPQIEESLKNITKKKIFTLDDLSGLEENVNDTVLLEVPDEKLTDTVLQKIFLSCKPGSRLIVNKVTDLENAEFLLKTGGFTDVQTKEKTLIAIKPKYEIGSSAKLNLRKPAVWKIDGDEEENIDPDELLDEDDLKKPDPNSLRVCGTTGKRKACKDCSCGLAEELAGEAKTGQVIDTTNAPKSSCGNCYLGDAFRCASCPYLGMPAFKPGEKIQLTENLLKADV